MTVTHALGTRFTGTGTFNYFRYEGVSADTRRRSGVFDVRDPGRHAERVVPERHAARAPDRPGRVQPARRRGGDAGTGQFLASRASSDFPFTSLTKFRRPSVRYQADAAWAAGQRLSVGYDWERETNPNVAGFDLDNNGFFVQQQSAIADRWFATIGVRVDSKERLQHLRQPQAVGGRIPRAGAARTAVVAETVRQHRPRREVADVHRAVRRRGFADPNPDIKVELARSGDVGLEATFADQRLRASAIYFDNHFTDQISFRPGTAGDGIPEYINIDGSKANGWEIELAVQKPVLGVTAVGHVFVG